MTQPFSPRRQSRWGLAVLADALLVTVLLAALARFCLTTYLQPFYYDLLAVSFAPTGGLLPIPLLPALGVCVGAGLTATAVWSLPRFRWLAAGVLLAAAGGLLYYHRLLLSWGALALWETLSILFTDATGFPGYFVWDALLSPTLRQQAIQSLLAAVTALYALALAWAVVRLRRFWPVFALTLPWLIPAFLAEVELDWPALMAVCACWAALLLASLSARAGREAGARVTLLALPASLTLILGVSLAFPRQDYVQPTWATAARDELLALDWFASGSPLEGGFSDTPNGGTEALAEPEVDLSAAGPRRYTGRAVLQVEATHAGPMYLRGLVYSDYTGSAWTGLQIHTLSGQAAQALDGAAQGLSAARIQSLSGSSTLAYLPYRTVQVQDVSTAPAAALALPEAVAAYSVSYLPLKGEPIPEGELDSAVLEGGLSRYLEVPQQASAFLHAWYQQAQWELADSGVQPAGGATGPYAWQLNTAALIAQLLARNAQYDLGAPAVPEEEDFVSHFLGESGRGYCVHFASAAALLLRLEGIPARYVSGYAVNIPGSGQAQVLDSNAHAWVEIYLEGYGWYPVEATPSVPSQEDPEPQPSATPTPTPAPFTTPSRDPESTLEPDATLPPQQTPGEQAETEAGTPIWLAWAIPLLAVLAAPWVLWGLRRLGWRRLERRPDANAAVLAAWVWFQQLERWGGQAGPMARELAGKARFSQHILTPEERSQMLAELGQEILRVRQGLPMWKRLPFALLFPLP